MTDEAQHHFSSNSTSPMNSTSYPPTPMQNAYAYSPHIPPGHDYRQTTSVASMPHSVVSLPPLRMDAPVQHHHAYSHHHIPYSSGHAIPTYHTNAYRVMAHSGQPLSALGSPEYMRFPIHALSSPVTGRSNKKEIKRRTKTGCMTCRKRRIKCDEQHPICRNCVKSKRECLGYDPIFKPQSGQQSNQQMQSSVSPTATTPTSTATASSSAMVIPTPSNAQAPALPLTPISETHAPVIASHQHQQPARPPPPIHYSTSINTPYSNSAAKLPAMTPSVQVKPHSGVMIPVSVEKLFLERSLPPYNVLDLHGSMSQDTQNDIFTLYNNDLAPGFDSILEVKWYSEKGIDDVLKDHEMCRLLATLLTYYSRFKDVTSYDVESQCRTKALECKTVWSLLTLIRRNPPSEVPHGDSYQAQRQRLCYEEAICRLNTLEALLTNSILPSNPLDAISYPSNMVTSPEMQSQIDFWHSVGSFVATTDEKIMWSTIISVRDLLGNIENRDVIYSMMICRFFADRIDNFTASFSGPPTSESDPVNRALLAKTFLINEATGYGTNHPIQRISHMAVESWFHR
ncbi:hypothetical protein BT63DRAFT_456809 [Microthyrium microscopicum]|uniref:Zn(2)-C6 fungal-type domain-containing protein n=1 Tax=Microthyrium microscopicum TaxID=703497 RepID=A0A6A6U9E5_9PEZI|nr:hypothetical protein BT63DRAFT_456809 [Microthyrium microscopicum]